MDKFAWWTELTHGGVLISNPVLNELFTEVKIDPDNWKYRRLRDHYNAFQSKLETHSTGTHPVHAWITNLFEDFLGHNGNQWLKGQNIPRHYSVISNTGLALKPHRVFVNENNEPILLFQTDQSPRLGMHKGRRSYAQFIELLRRTNVSLGVLTNGHQIRLAYAGLDYDAWVQWQFDAWFDEGETRHQLDGFVTLLSPEVLKIKDGTFPLLDAVNLSRSRQADLADVLGDQIRQAVEIITSAIGRAQQKDNNFLDTVQISPGSESILSEVEMLNAIYQAATRLVMRMVILFYAEAKNLLPKDSLFYTDNYSLEGLYAQLLAASQHEGESELETRYSAWPRFLALSKIVHKGSEHEILPLKAYGGSLFRSGDADHSDPVFRALSLFENPNLSISDHEVYSILRLIKIGKTKVSQGRGFSWVSGPVDFTDLRTEYIGIMYEGLLDYELKIVEKDSPKVILNIGNQPILPLTLLDPMDNRAIKNLFEKMEVDKESSPVPVLQETESREIEDSEINRLDDFTPYGRALNWAVNAVEAARLIRRPRPSSVAQQQYEERKLTKARSLIVKVLEPGEMYLARWGGTRKGTGTFYTKPALAVPTTHRTLEPLVYEVSDGSRTIKAPADILNLKICDPAVGSGTFLVAAARYLTEALYESILTHTLTSRDEDGNIIDVPMKIPLTSDMSMEPPPIKSTDEGWEDQMKARLKRLVVEHCLFGVDFNGMAVELARLALWLETMDKDLPFEFLAHRIKQGNSLVGSWFSHFQNYPPKAWERKDGTGKAKHNRDILRNQVIPELVKQIKMSEQYDLFETYEPPDVILNRQLEFWRELEHTKLFDMKKREEIYREKIEDDLEYKRLKHHFDRWSAVWLWPSEDKDKPILSPMNFFNDDRQITDIVNELKATYHFFHWPLEFPLVFVKLEQDYKNIGFDAIIGNPPWDIQQPNSQEFFSNYDPIYRTYGKQEALRKQKEMFDKSPEVEKAWINYFGGFQAMANYVRNSSNPYNVTLARGGSNQELHNIWSSRRKRQPHQHDDSYPFSLQGSANLNSFKLFLEQSFHLLKKGGRLGMIFPSGIYTDKGCTDLRKTFLNDANWEWLFSFENKEKIFDIHRSFKFGPVILTKGGQTRSVKSAFMRHDIKEWESPKPPHLKIPVEKIKRFNPNTLSFIEFKSDMDLRICTKIYGDRLPLVTNGESHWNARISREFNATDDSNLFISREELIENKLLSKTEDTRDPRVLVRLWKAGYTPIYRGGNIYIDDPYYKPFETFIPKEQFKNPKVKINKTLITRTIARSTDTRTLICEYVPWNFISINSVFTWTINGEPSLLAAQLNSFCVDYLIRMQVSANVNVFYLEGIPALGPFDIDEKIIKFMKGFYGLVPKSNPIERLSKICMRDAIIFKLFDLNIDEVKHVLSTFPNVDRALPIEQRQTTLTFESFKYLEKVGEERFLEEGWELPGYITEFERIGVKIWEPECAWKNAWKEAKTALSETEWKEFVGELSVNESTAETDRPNRTAEPRNKYKQKKLEFK